MKTYLKAFDGTTASITEHRDGTATLKVKTVNGKTMHNKTHANAKAAKAAWYRLIK